MSRAVKLFDLHPSPHNIKVRLALAHKKIPCELIPVDFQDRDAVIRASGQPLTPVLMHGDTVVYDSYAILRYLDGNWQTPPRLYSTDRKTMQRIEEWERFARNDASTPIGMVFGEIVAGSRDAEKLKKANELINHAASSRLEEVLASSPYLMGDAPNAADFSVAPWMYYGALPESVGRSSPVHTLFYESIRIENAPKTIDWIGRVMALDG